MTTIPLSLLQEAEKPSPSPLVDLYVLDASEIGGSVMYLHPAVGRNGPVNFNGVSYNPMPMKIEGFELRGRGEIARPSVTFSNIQGLFTALVLGMDDLIGAKFIRRRTFARFLDDGEEPNSSAIYPDEVWYINRKVEEGRLAIKFELASPLDVSGIQLPRRLIQANMCQWQYRDGYCGYAQDRFVADDKNTMYAGTQTFRGAYSATTQYYRYDVVYRVIRSVRHYYLLIALQAKDVIPPNAAFWSEDVCSKSVAGCRLRFDPDRSNQPLPYGGFPGCDKISSV